MAWAFCLLQPCVYHLAHVYETPVVIHSDAEVFVANLSAGESAEHSFKTGYGYVQVVRGIVRLSENGSEETLEAGDGVAMSDAQHLTLTAQEDVELLLFDLQ